MKASASICTTLFLKWVAAHRMLEERDFHYEAHGIDRREGKRKPYLD